MNMMAEASDSPSCPKSTKSPTIAPTSLPLGPPLTYPTEQKILPMITASPRTAAGMGKQIPAMKCMARQEGANSMKLQWALWALLNLYHCWQVSLAEYLPLPMSGYPPFSISFPVALLCSSPKLVFMNYSVKTSPLTLPGKKKPMSRISKAMRTPTSRTQPQSEERVQVSELPTDVPAWMSYMCIFYNFELICKACDLGFTNRKYNYIWFMCFSMENGVDFKEV